MATTDPLIVLGAGCAGLSLAAALVRAGIREPIVVVDRRTDWPDDRTWCFWDTGDVAHAELSRHSWNAWAVVTPRGRAVARAARHPYRHLHARDLYDRLLAELAAAPNVELQTRTAVRAVREVAGGVEVRTDRGTLVGRHVFDAMGGGGPLLRGRPDGAVELRQAFLGQVVECERPAFDPAVATLMDFRVPQDDGLRFVYVLPFSSTRALVEDTHIGTASVPPARRREAVREYLARHHGVDRAVVVAEERGNLPMSSWSFPAVRSERVSAVGAAAGAIRPSSGYAFVRLQRHVQAVAAATAAHRPMPAGPQRGRRAALDRVFLQALEHDPGAFPECFRTLAGGVDGDLFARFMSDTSTPGDDARVVAALPPRMFLAASARILAASAPSRRPADLEVAAPRRPRPA